MSNGNAAKVTNRLPADNGDLWLRHIPLPKILDLILQFLGTESDQSRLPIDLIEKALPYLCFALPLSAKRCVKLLQCIPRHSHVWDELEEGLLNKKYLPVEIISTIYEQRPDALEREIMHVLTLYIESDQDTCGMSEMLQDLGNVRNDGEPSEPDSCILLKMGNNGNGGDSPWKESSVALAAAHSNFVFDTSLKILSSLVVDSNYSVNTAMAVRDFYAYIIQEVKQELYSLFPRNVQHLVYLLTLPLVSDCKPTTSVNACEVAAVEEAILEVLQTEDDAICTIRVLLCCFPSWLFALHQRKFLDRYLRYQSWDFVL